MSDYDDREWREQQAAKAQKLADARAVESAIRLRATVAADMANQRSNPALKDAYVPHVWTEAEETELAERMHGTEQERIDRMLGNN